MKKNSCTPINPKKNSYKEFDNEKKFLPLENSPPPPITFLMVGPLGNMDSVRDGMWIYSFGR